MRPVGIGALRAFIAAVLEVENASARGLAATQAAAAKCGNLVAQGRDEEAAEFGAGALATWKMEIVAIGARYEKAAVDLLGERRRPDESTETYVFRTMAAAQDFQRMRAMQAANDLVYVG